MPAIVLDHVSKRFTMQQDRPRSLQEVVLSLAQRGRGRQAETFWALRDVSFTMRQGETCGIIGENGSGKSTLLKLITRILQPTEGVIQVNGRIAALLELGAGFHPDLTGRDNIYLNGSILGLSRREMQERFDEIVSFAELERFIDVPLKHYSSGMQVRLGFAIATSIDPDILLIDEVLAVGDEAFQHKCLARIDEFRARNKTIVFVSHDLATVNRLCDRAVWLEDGVVRDQGLTRRVIDFYLASVEEKENRQLAGSRVYTEVEPAAPPPPSVEATPSGMLAAVEPPPVPEPRPEEPTHWGSGEIRITDVRLIGEEGEHKHLFRCGESMAIEIHYEAFRHASDVVFGVGIYRSDGLFCYGTNTEIEKLPLSLSPGKGVVRIEFARFAFIEGTYSLDVAIHTSKGIAYDYYRSYHVFAIRSSWKDMGVFRPEHRWIIGGVVHAISEKAIAPDGSAVGQ